jgi:hypothetical protein
MQNEVVNTDLLGKAIIPDQRFENPDGTGITIDTDFFGTQRNPENPFPGPFQADSPGLISVIVWSEN